MKTMKPQNHETHETLIESYETLNETHETMKHKKNLWNHHHETHETMKPRAFSIYPKISEISVGNGQRWRKCSIWHKFPFILTLPCQAT